MNLLLDTHTFLWAIGQPSRLSEQAKALIQDEDNELVLSVASLWEIALKVRAGKLHLPQEEGYLRDHIGNLGIKRLLAIQPTHIYALFQLEDHHRDPFDRLLVTQCQTERLILLSADLALRAYPIQVLW